MIQPLSLRALKLKDTTVVFTKHLKSDCHKEADEIHELPKKTGDIHVGEKLSSEHKNEKKLNRNVQENASEYSPSCSPGSTIEGHDDVANSNFM